MRLRNCKVISEHDYPDTQGLMTQLCVTWGLGTAPDPRIQLRLLSGRETVVAGSWAGPWSGQALTVDVCNLLATMAIV